MSNQKLVIWIIAVTLALGVAVVAVVILNQGEGPPDYQTSLGGKASTEPGEFSEPCGVCVDSAGNLYVLDTGNSRIERFKADGELISLWGEPGSDENEFNNARRIARDSENNIWVADTDNHRCCSHLH